MKMFLHLIKGKTLQVLFTGMVLALMIISTGYAQAQTYNLPITGTDAVRCGAGEVTLTIQWSGETLNPEKVKWYKQPFYGTPFHTGISYTTEYLEYTTPFYVDYIGEDGCSQCDRLLVRAVIADITITPQVIYPSLTFCNSSNITYTPSVVGAESGTFSVNNQALLVNPATGAINPFNVPAGNYQITFIPDAVEGCDSDPVLVALTITNRPQEPEISYSPDNLCSTHENVPVTFSIDGYQKPIGAFFTVSPSGLSLNSNTGVINPSASQTGVYSITYTVPGGGGCPPVIKSTHVTILQLPSVSISYNSPFTLNMGAQQVQMSGTGNFTGGIFSHNGIPGNLDLNTATGEIVPANSVEGTYEITYRISAVSPCVGEIEASTTIEILSLPVAQISVEPFEVCQFAVNGPEITFNGSAGSAPYTINYSINDGAIQDIITTGSSAIIEHPVSIAGTYTYKIHSISDNNGSTRNYGTGSEPFVTFHINIQSHGSFDYADSPYCNDGINPLPTMLDGGVKGTFTSTAGLVFVDAATGEIDISASIPGTYAVTNTIAASGGCPGSVTIVDVTITALPIAGFSYAEAYCNSGTNPTPTLNEGGEFGLFSVTPPGLVFVSITTGEIDLASSVPGTYTITNTVAAGNGCGVVTASDEVTIEPLPVVTNDDEMFICSNMSPYIELTASLASSFTWTIGNITGGITGAEAGNGNIIDQVLINSSNTESGTVEYIIVPTSTAAGCTGNEFTITVTVKPLPVLTSILTPTAICSNLAFEYEATSDATGATFSWSRAAIPGILQDASSGTTASINEVLTNTSNAPINVVYEYTITADGCSNTQNVTVAVNPTPSITNAVLEQAICSGGTTEAVTLTSDILGATLSWIAYPSAGITGHIDNGTGTIPAQTLINSLTTDGTVTYVIAPTLGNCYGAEAEYVVTVHALPVCEINGPETVTYGDETEFTAPAGMTSYAWSISGDGSIVGASNVQTVDVSADGAGSYTLSLTIINNNGCTSSCEKIVTVDKALLTVNADNKTVTYGDTTPDLTYEITGFVNDETASVVSGTPELSTSYTATTPVADSPVTISATTGTLAAANYSFAFVDGAITINKAELTVTAGNKTVTYGDTTPILTYEITGFVNDETVSVVSGTPALSTSYTATTPVADSPVTISAANGTLAAANYSFAFVAGAITINMAELTITADNKVKGVDADDPELTVTYSGFVGDDNTGNLAGTLTITRAEGESVGDYTITASGLTSDNYTISYQTGTLTIAEVIVEASLGIAIAAYNTLDEAFTAINAGIHKGDIIIRVYADTTEPEDGATLAPSGTGQADYTSVSIIAENNVIINGSVILESAEN